MSKDANQPETGLTAGERDAREELRARRWRMIRDVGVFQGKLFLDGIRDVLLAPAALVVGIVAVVAPGPRTESWFFDILKLGNHLERWINLFGALRRRDPTQVDEPESDANVDVVVDHIERILREQSSKGGVTGAAKERIDSLLDSIQRN